MGSNGSGHTGAGGTGRPSRSALPHSPFHRRKASTWSLRMRCCPPSVLTKMGNFPSRDQRSSVSVETPNTSFEAWAGDNHAGVWIMVAEVTADAADSPAAVFPPSEPRHPRALKLDKKRESHTTRLSGSALLSRPTPPGRRPPARPGRPRRGGMPSLSKSHAVACSASPHAVPAAVRSALRIVRNGESKRSFPKRKKRFLGCMPSETVPRGGTTHPRAFHSSYIPRFAAVPLLLGAWLSLFGDPAYAASMPVPLGDRLSRPRHASRIRRGTGSPSGGTRHTSRQSSSGR